MSFSFKKSAFSGTVVPMNASDVHTVFVSRRAHVATITLLLFFGVFILSHSASAGVISGYDGCFEREATDTSATVWMKQSTCDVTLTNSGLEYVDFVLTVDNVHPYLTVIKDSTGAVIPATRTSTAVSVSIPLSSTAGALSIPGANSTTVTIDRWDRDDDDDDFWMASISDPQNHGGTSIPNGIFTEIAGWMSSIQPDFVTVSGDIIRGSSTSPETQIMEYEAYFDVFSEFAGSMFLVPGDHDARQNMDEFYSSYFGSRDFTYTWGGVRFIGLSTQEVGDPNLGKLTDEQMEWFETTLAAVTEETIVVYFHHPLIPPPWAGSLGIQESQRADMAELMDRYGVDLLIAGDVHGYEYRDIDSSDFPNMTGSFKQLLAGGAGGRIMEYTGSHFMLMLHFSPEGTEVYRLDSPDMDFDVTTDELNDGTEQLVTFSVSNDGEVTVPYARLIANTSGNGYAVVTDADGLFYSSNTQVVDGAERTTVQLTDLIEGTALDITMGERSTLYTNFEHQLTDDGVVDFSSGTPGIDSVLTDLRVTSVSGPSSISVTAWDVEKNDRRWTQSSSKSSTVQFEITALLPSREYDVILNNNLIDRISTSDEGVTSFLYEGGVASRTFSLQLHKEIPVSNIGVLPAASGGSNFRLYGNSVSLLSTFFAYTEKLKHGYESVWADVDADGVLEVVTVPSAGAISRVRIFENDGKQKASFYPFGKEYTGGVSLAVADLTGEGKDELVVGRGSLGEATVQVYSYRAQRKNGVKKIRSFRAYPTTYKEGVEVTTGDFDGNGKYELAVSTRGELDQVKLYRWRKTKRPKLLTTLNPATKAQSGFGITIAAGDVDFDGKDELITGSRRGNSSVAIFNYQPKKQQLIEVVRRLALSREYEGGVSLNVGNFNANNREEILVTARAATEQSQARVMRLKKAKQLFYMGRLRPLDSAYTGGVSASVTDLDGDWIDEVLLAPVASGGTIFQYTREKNKWKREQRITPYGSSYNSGLQLTQ